jgi:tRNA threonylcarbamoyladenosine biosynthesis protein TsaE
MELTVSSVSELPLAAKKILDFAGANRIFLFYGSMGAGKTTLIRALCEELEIEGSASSPTFSIVNEYTSPMSTIYHFDFYRIKSETEALDLGYEDYLYSGDYCFIEWPEKIENLLPQRFVELKLLETSENERIINIQQVG